MFFHVIENTMQDGVQGYRHIRTYKTYSGLENFLRKDGRPLWVVESRFDAIQYRYNSNLYGGFTASYWNTGGWGTTTMPVMPIF